MNSARLYQIMVCVLLGTVLSGCATYRRVTFNTNPKGAEVRISSDQGLRNFPIGKTEEMGLTYVFRFDPDPSMGPSTYNVDFQLQGYEPATIAIRRADEQYNPATVTMNKSDDRTEFHVKLEREVVREVKRLEPVISEEAGYILEPRTVRAWVEDIEREAKTNRATREWWPACALFRPREEESRK